MYRHGPLDGVIFAREKNLGKRLAFASKYAILVISQS